MVPFSVGGFWAPCVHFLIATTWAIHVKAPGQLELYFYTSERAIQLFFLIAGNPPELSVVVSKSC